MEENDLPDRETARGYVQDQHQKFMDALEHRQHLVEELERAQSVLADAARRLDYVIDEYGEAAGMYCDEHETPHRPCPSCGRLVSGCELDGVCRECIAKVEATPSPVDDTGDLEPRRADY